MNLILGHRALVPDKIGLGNLVSGGNQAMKKVAVVCENQKALGVLVQPACGYNALSEEVFGEKLHHGPAYGILGGCDKVTGLVHHADHAPSAYDGNPVHFYRGIVFDFIGCI